MQTSPIFETGGARTFGGANVGSGSGDLFLALLKESAARQDADPPVFPETTRPDEPRRETDGRVEDRREVPHRAEETRRPATERHDEHRETDEVRREPATRRAEDTDQGRSRAERETSTSAAADEAHAGAGQEAGSGTETTDAAAAETAQPVEPEASPETADATNEVSGPASQTDAANPTVDAATVVPQVPAPAAPDGETATDGSGEASSESDATQALVADDPAAALSAQTAASGTATLSAMSGAAVVQASQTTGATGTPATAKHAPKTDPLLTATMVSADTRRVAGGAQGTPKADGVDPGAVRSAGAGLEARLTPAGQVLGDQTSVGSSALAAATALGQANAKALGNGSAMKPAFTLAAATSGTASAGQAEAPLPAHLGMSSLQAGSTAARALGEVPVTTSRPSGPAVPIGEVAVHIQRAAAKGEERIRIQLHPAELGQIDVRLKLGTDGVTRAMVQVERPETLDLLQRDARGLERALQDAGLKTDSNSLSFSLRDHGQGGLYEGYGLSAGYDGAAEGSGLAEASEDLEAQTRPMLSNRALDIHV